jgi:hypothetical protein
MKTTSLRRQFLEGLAFGVILGVGYGLLRWTSESWLFVALWFIVWNALVGGYFWMTRHYRSGTA